MILAIAGVVLTVYAAVHLVNGIVDFARSVFSGASPLFTGSITVEEILIGIIIGFVVAYTIRKNRMSRKAEAGTAEKKETAEPAGENKACFHGNREHA